MLDKKTINKFRKVYADAIDINDNRKEVCKRRELRWHGNRMPLADAAQLYQMISEYNNFNDTLVHAMATTFPDAGIEVIPARDYSVAIYLFIPEQHREQVENYIKNTWGADEIDWEKNNEDPNINGSLRVWWD